MINLYSYWKNALFKTIASQRMCGLKFQYFSHKNTELSSYGHIMIAFSKKGNKKHENNHGKQSPVRFRVILDINWLLCEEFKMHPHFWYESIRSAMTPWNCVQLLFVFLQAGAVICKKEILVKGVNGGFCYLTYLNNKIICLLIFPLLYCQVMLSTVTPIITKISSSARGIRQLQIVQLTSQWSGKCAVKQIRRGETADCFT